MKYAFIERNRRVWPISVQCRALEVSISGYHEHFIRLASAVQATMQSTTARQSSFVLRVATSKGYPRYSR